MQIDLFIFFLYCLMGYTRGCISIDEEGSDALKVASIKAMGLFVTPILVFCLCLLTRLAWNTVMARWLGDINLTQACALLMLGWLVVPFSTIKHKI